MFTRFVQMCTLRLGTITPAVHPFPLISTTFQILCGPHPTFRRVRRESECKSRTAARVPSYKKNVVATTRTKTIPRNPQWAETREFVRFETRRKKGRSEREPAPQHAQMRVHACRFTGALAWARPPTSAGGGTTSVVFASAKGGPSLGRRHSSSAHTTDAA